MSGPGAAESATIRGSCGRFLRKRITPAGITVIENSDTPGPRAFCDRCGRRDIDGVGRRDIVARLWTTSSAHKAAKVVDVGPCV